ncbi:MAG: biopolymer transporter ExbD [bacterium]|nr:biopolymer transporter ExbD [bacterium]
MKKNLFQQKQGLMGINVTPIIDVALVLVIILMITAPIMTISDLAVDLPRAHAHSNPDTDRLNITVNPAGQVAVDKVIVPREDLPGTLANRLAVPGMSNLMVVVRADGAVAHQVVRGVLKDARSAGARRLAIATARVESGREQEMAWTP